jgi:hypothetical protein
MKTVSNRCDRNHINPYFPNKLHKWKLATYTNAAQTKAFSMSNQQKPANLAGAAKKEGLRVTFDGRVKVEFHGSKVTSDAGLLAYRDLDAALGLTDLGDDVLHDWRTDIRWWR